MTQNESSGSFFSSSNFVILSEAAAAAESKDPEKAECLICCLQVFSPGNRQFEEMIQGEQQERAWHCENSLKRRGSGRSSVLLRLGSRGGLALDDSSTEAAA